MKKTTVITAVMVMLLFANWAQAGVSIVMNGSFENNGQIPDITAEEPRYWWDVNVPSDKFGGEIMTNWSTRGDYSLTLYSIYNEKCNEENMTILSQQVYLADVNQIIFDLELSSSKGKWDPSKRSAVVLIDGNDIWDSNSLGSSIGDVSYSDVVVPVDINDANVHILSLAIRSNVTETSKPYEEFRTRWDFVKFDAHCGGFGYWPGDFSLDCYVDFIDFAMLANHWLEQDTPCRYDLFEDGIVDGYDLGTFVEGWLECTYWGEERCYELELLASDIDDSGAVDYGDISMLGDYWLLEGEHLRADLSEDGIVNLRDFAIIADEWALMSWLYCLD
ncbi:MAG: hypothetical protein ACYS21_20115 [Planctomycetota bacterium]|jgi:hypothetical protein